MKSSHHLRFTGSELRSTPKQGAVTTKNRHALALLLAGASFLGSQKAGAYMPPFEWPEASQQKKTLTAMYHDLFPHSAIRPEEFMGDAKMLDQHDQKKEEEVFCFAGDTESDGDLTLVAPDIIQLDITCDDNGHFTPSEAITIHAHKGRFKLPFEENVFLVVEENEPVIVWEEKGIRKKLEKEGGNYSLLSTTAALNLTPLNVGSTK